MWRHAAWTGGAVPHGETGEPWPTRFAYSMDVGRWAAALDWRPAGRLVPHEAPPAPAAP